MTVELQFSPEIRQELRYQRYNHPAPLVQRRMEALWLKAHKLPHGQIAQLLGVRTPSENILQAMNKEAWTDSKNSTPTVLRVN